MYVGQLQAGKDHRKAAAERRNWYLSLPTIFHSSKRVVLIPTAVGCCPSAARTRQADRRDHNLIRWSASCILAELEAADLQLLFAVGDRW